MDNSKKTELVAPDGGYGYVILVAVIINLSIYNVYINCYGLIYKDYFSELNMDSRDITTLAGFSALCSAIAGFSTAPLLKVLSKRKTALLAAAFINFGSICTVFAKSKIIFYIFQGVFQNVGNGIIFNVSNTIINEYFVKNRFLVISISSTVVAVVCFVAPQILRFTSELYGFRGTLICVCAVSFQAFVAGGLMQPVSWHMKKVNVSSETEIKLLANKDDTNDGPLKVDSSIKDMTQKSILMNVSKQENNGILCRLKNLVDVKLIKSFTFSIACLGPSLSLITDLTYLYMLPQALHSYGWSEANVAWAFSLIALGDLVMRVVLILLSQWLNKISSSTIYAFGVTVTFFARIGVTMSNDVPATLVFLTVMGATRCIIFMLIVLVISESVSPDKFSTAIGFFMLSSGMENLTLAPIIGAVRDYTRSYTTALNLMTGVFGILGAVWIGKLAFCKVKKRSNKDDNVT